jgi:TolB protein
LLALAVLGGCDSVAPPDQPDVRRVDRFPAWSPSGDRIAYLHDAGPTEDSTDVTGLYVRDLETDSTWLVTEGLVTSPDWRSDGRRIAFAAGDIFTVRPDGSDRRRVTEFGDSFFPSWSSSGSRLAFDTSYRNENGAHVIWLIDPNESKLKDISQHGVGEWRNPDWSPDERRLVHLRFLSGVLGEEVFVMDSTGSNAIRLTDNERNDRNPSWSPNGDWIVWASITEDGSEIWIMRSDGRDKRSLVERGREPAWGPNSERIVFSKPASDSDYTALWTIRRDGSDLRQITDPSRNPLN